MFRNGRESSRFAYELQYWSEPWVRTAQLAVLNETLDAGLRCNTAEALLDIKGPAQTGVSDIAVRVVSRVGAPASGKPPRADRGRASHLQNGSKTRADSRELERTGENSVGDRERYRWTLGRHEEAIPLFQELHSSNPDNDNVVVLLAHNYFKNGEYQKAIPLAQDIPDDSEWYLKSISLTGASFAEQGKHDLAIEALTRAPLRKKSLDDDLMEIHYNLAESYRETGNQKKAIQHYNRVYAQDAEYLDVAEKLSQLGG